MTDSSTSSPARLRVGTVPYLVARPLDLGLDEEPGIALRQDVPAKLVAALREGELDIALVSSIELFRRPGYRYLAGLGVIAENGVSSVKVFHEKPWDEVRTVALDPASRTAATLTRVVLPDRSFLEVEPGNDPAQAGADAWLRIGDAALREHFEHPERPAFDPARAWTAETGLPFVFALWIARPEIDLEPWRGAFARSRARGAEAAKLLADQAAERWNLPREDCRRYLLEESSYELGPLPQSASLFAFRDRAAKLDLCAPDLKPAAVSLTSR